MITERTRYLFDIVFRNIRVAGFWPKAHLMSPLTTIHPCGFGRPFDTSEDTSGGSLQKNVSFVGYLQ